MYFIIKQLPSLYGLMITVIVVNSVSALNAVNSVNAVNAVKTCNGPKLG